MVAREMACTDVPSNEDFEGLLRDMPRFEMAALPPTLRLTYWKFFGEGIVRSRIKAGLNDLIGSSFKEELHLYGTALSQWSRLVVRKLENFVNSHADAYRVQIHRMSGTSEKVIDVGQLEEDAALLAKWDASGKRELAEKSV